MARLSIRLVRMPLLSSFTTSFGTETVKNALILQLEEGGVKAYGESVTSVGPFYGYEDNTTALHIIRDYLAEMVKGTPSPEEFLERSARLKGHNMAKAAVEMLLWDYHAKKSGVSLSRALGKSKGYADVGISLGMDKREVTLRKVREAIDRGYRRVKLKIEKGKEYDIVKSARDEFPDVELSADANACYSLKDMTSLKRLDRLGLVYLEQPLGHDDLIDHSLLAKQLSTPICLDESITTLDSARQAFEIGAAKVVNIKPGRVGGLVNSLSIARLARNNGGHVWVGGMLETGFGRAFNIALAANNLIDYPGDTSPNDKYFARDLVKNPFNMDKGRIRPNKGSGIGVESDDRFLESVTLKTWRLW